MEGKLQTSFIPKRPIVETKPHNAPTTNIFYMVAWFIFIVVVAGCVGVYFYEQYLNSTINAKNAELTNLVEQFNNTASVDHFVQLDARLKAANVILNSHLAFTALLGLISVNTLQSVQWTDLKYSYDDSSGKVTLFLNGRAPDFASVALQSDKLSTLTYFNNQNIAGILLDTTGAVLFNFSASIDPSVLKYVSTLQVQTTPTATTPITTSPTVGTSTNASQ